MTGSRSPEEGTVFVMRAGVFCAKPVLSIASPRVAAVPIFIASRRETSDLRMVSLRRELVRRLPDLLASHGTKGHRVQSFWGRAPANGGSFALRGTAPALHRTAAYAGTRQSRRPLSRRPRAEGLYAELRP